MKAHLSLMKLLLLSILITLISSSNKTTTIMLSLYSGRENPTIELTDNQLNELEQLVSENTFTLGNSNRYFGYSGYLIPKLGLHLQGYPAAEMYLLNLLKDQIDEEQYQEILDIISIEYIESPSKPLKLSASFEQLEKTLKLDPQCDKTPMRGSDDVYPPFDPYTNHNGCYLDRQFDNNCYNYATNVLTNTFAQPGNSKGVDPKPYSCERVILAAEADGLIYLGKSIDKKPAKGHYIASVIGRKDHHWIRMGDDRKWSHKGGCAKIVNHDANGDIIIDPSVQDFGMWNVFCGYFLVIPSQINIK
jgi:hypothetical protein